MERTRAAARRDRIGSRMFWQATAIVFLAVALGLLVNQLRPGRLPLVADWSPEAQLTLESVEILVISLDEARDSFFSGKAVFLDARSHELYKLGHITGSRNLPWNAVDENFDTVMADIHSDALLIAYCDGESCSESKDLALDLFYRGYENVRVLVNGWSLWKEYQLPMDKGP